MEYFIRKKLIHRCLNFFSILLLFMGYIAMVKSACPSYEQNTKVLCPKDSKCFCNTIDDYHMLECPADEPSLIVLIKPGRHVRVECARKSAKDLDLLPCTSIGDVPHIEFLRCPLSEQRTTRKLLDILGVRKLQSLHFKNFIDTSNSKLLRDHLRQFTAISTLEISRNEHLNLPEDAFADLKNLTYLDLKSNGIRHLSKNIFANLDNLKYLELGNNNLQTLDDGVFRNQNQLRRLNLWSNRLTSLTKDSFVDLSSITELDISSNGIQYLESDVFVLLTNLIELNLNGNNFTSLPEGLFKHNKELQYIRLLENRNELNTLPSKLFADLPKLKKVLITSKLKWLPDDLFTNSMKLTNISLSKNMLKQLPSKLFSDQIHLLDLDLRWNQLTELSKGLFTNVRSLLVLRLSYNNINSIQANIFNGLENLRELYLDNNNLYSFDREAFPNQSPLKILDLANNNLSLKDITISPLLSNLIEQGSPLKHLNQLEILILRNNSIRQIFQDWMFSFTHLQKLDLSYNLITKISYLDLQFLSRNISISFKKNLIKEIDLTGIENLVTKQNFNTVTTNTHIGLDENPIECTCALLDVIKFMRNELSEDLHKIIKITPNDLKCFIPNMPKSRVIKDIVPEEFNCPRRDELRLVTNCPLVCTCWMRPADRALILNCSYADLIKMPLQPYPDLKEFTFTELYIENNQLTELPDFELTTLPEIRKIYAKNNKINKIDSGNLPRSLTALDLSYNNLTQLVPASIHKLEKLQSLALGHNPWTCNCNSIQLFAFITNSFKIITDIREMQCINGIKIITMQPSDLCRKDETYMIGMMLTFAGLFIAILTAIYFHMKKHPKFTPKTDRNCDVFISYSLSDKEFVMKNLISTLVNENKIFTLYQHVCDLTTSDRLTAANITNLMENAQTTIVVLSSDYLTSIGGQHEIHAIQNLIQSKKYKRIIFILCQDLNNINIDQDLKGFLKFYSYLRWDAADFPSQLRNALSTNIEQLPPKFGA